MCPLITQLLRLVGSLESNKPVNPHQLGGYRIPTERPKSIRKRCVMEDFGGVCMLSLCYFVFSVGVGALVIGLSQISSFFSHCFNVISESIIKKNLKLDFDQRLLRSLSFI